MARMPQIPAPEITSRPDSRNVGPTTPVDFGEATRPIEQAADMMAGVGDRLEQAQAERDDAQAKLQKVVDGVNATRMAGDHAEKARNLLGQIQQQYWDTPEKVPDEYQRQLREMTDSEIKSTSDQNSGLALDIAQRYAKVDNDQVAAAHGWMVRRQAQIAGDGVYKITQSAVRTAQAQGSVGDLGAAIAGARKTLGPILPQVHGGNAEKVMGETAHSMASAWVEATGPTNPLAVRQAVDDALKTKSGPLWDNLKPNELAAYAKKLDGWTKGYGERQRSAVAAEAVDFNTKTLDLFHSKELDSRNLFQMRDELQRKMFAIKHDPQYKDNPDERVQQSEIVQTSIDTIDALRDASQNGGGWKDKTDPKATAALFKRYEALSKSEGRAPNDLLKVLQVQRDLAQMQAHHTISPGDAETLTRGLRLLTGTSLAAQNKGAATGPLRSPIEPSAPRVVGASALDAYIQSGAYGKLSDGTKADMRAEYHRLVNDAGEVSAKKMALLAIQHVLARSRKEE